MNLIKYPKIYAIGNEENELIFLDGDDTIFIEEKIDGANFRFMFKDGEAYFGSRNCDLEGEGSGNFKRVIQYLREKFDKVRDKYKPEGLMFCGENCVAHSVQYDWDRIPPYLGFDVIDLENGGYLDYDEKVSLFNKLDLPLVPLVRICNAKDIEEINEGMIPPSKYYDGQSEGIVFKNYKREIFAKLVTKKFKEKHMLAFGGSPKHALTDDAKMCATYVTNARIEKHIFKMIDEGEKLQMEMMKFLPYRIIHDIVGECGFEIFKSDWVISFKRFRSLTSKRCVSVLKNTLINNLKR